LITADSEISDAANNEGGKKKSWPGSKLVVVRTFRRDFIANAHNLLLPSNDAIKSECYQIGVHSGGILKEQKKKKYTHL
jgi:hypothetical protein